MPARLSLSSLRAAAASCRGCDLYRCGTQTVFGDGQRDARIVVIGEIPGDQEDKLGRPFVGPAGRVLRRALADAGVTDDMIYITNAVKHFKWTASGRRRVGKPPRSVEIQACLPWLAAELKVVKPHVLCCLGASAARAVLGRSVRIKDVRGESIPTSFGVSAFVTVHPSSLLRAGQVTDSAEDYRRFVDDLKRLRSIG